MKRRPCPASQPRSRGTIARRRAHRASWLGTPSSPLTTIARRGRARGRSGPL